MVICYFLELKNLNCIGGNDEFSCRGNKSDEDYAR